MFLKLAYVCIINIIFFCETLKGFGKVQNYSTELGESLGEREIVG
jgi:hypothetical protein